MHSYPAVLLCIFLGLTGQSNHKIKFYMVNGLHFSILCYWGKAVFATLIFLREIVQETKPNTGYSFLACNPHQAHLRPASTNWLQHVFQPQNLSYTLLLFVALFLKYIMAILCNYWLHLAVLCILLWSTKKIFTSPLQKFCPYSMQRLLPSSV